MIMINDIYYQRGYADPVFEDAYVLDLVRPFAADAKQVTAVDETGGEARTYAIDSDVILKVQRPQQLRLSTSLEKEVFFLNQLRGIVGLNVPKVLGYGKEGTVEYTLMTRMPGTAVRYTQLTQDERESALFDLGKMLTLIHSLDIEPFLSSGLFFDIDKTSADISDRLKYLFERALMRLSDKLSSAQIDKAKSEASELLSGIKNTYAVPCHANPGPDHTFVTNSKLSGIIDFADAYISHPIFDIRRWPLDDRKHVISGYISAKKTDTDFKVVCDISTALDNILAKL